MEDDLLPGMEEYRHSSDSDYLMWVLKESMQRHLGSHRWTKEVLGDPLESSRTWLGRTF